MFKAVLTLLTILSCCLPGFSFAEEKESGFFSKIGDAISGHANDVKARFSDETFIGGEVLRTSKLRPDARGSDTLHRGEGAVTIESKEGKFYLQFGSDTSITFAPDLNIYVSTTADILDEADFDKTEKTHIGEMTKPNGASFYELPADIKPEQIVSVVVWCKRFNEFMSSAKFEK